jgi:hypothetical protein
MQNRAYDDEQRRNPEEPALDIAASPDRAFDQRPCNQYFEQSYEVTKRLDLWLRGGTRCGGGRQHLNSFTFGG